MKLLFDFFPIILFFVAFKGAESQREAAASFATQWLGPLVSGGVVGASEAPVLLATVVVIAATFIQIGYLLARRRKVDAMLWVSLALVTVFGGATVWFHNETFIKWKPSVLYWAMGLAFWLSQALFRKNLLKTMLSDQLQLPANAWRTLNLMWITFFGFMGLANLYVAYSFPTDIWVNFKLFGSIGLMVLFTLAQGVYLSRHIEPEETGATE
jgi:intracellular septation protein